MIFHKKTIFNLGYFSKIIIYFKLEFDYKIAEINQYIFFVNIFIFTITLNRVSFNFKTLNKLLTFQFI